MTLEEFGRSLRQKREERNITLADISAYTRINQKFLEAIETGDFAQLPQTYIRAFLRGYAGAIEVPPEDVLREYDDARGVKPPPTQPKPAAQPTARKQPPPPDPLTPYVRALRPVVYGAIFVILAGAAYIVLRSPADPARTTQGEIPFDRVIRETEAAVPADSVRSFVPAPVPAVVQPVRQADSLMLEMTTTDSLWISIVIDNTRNEEYLFAPNRYRIWRAQERFVVTMGNAGGATFRLNGKDLGALGRAGAVVRNRIITADLLR